MNIQKNDEPPLPYTVLVALIVTILAIIAFTLPTPPVEAPAIELIDIPTQAEAAVKEVVAEEKAPSKAVTSIEAMVTGYNTVPEQTDSTPCIAASGDNICGRSDVVACPRVYPLGTEVVIDGKGYVCLDRTAKKFDGRFDISCDKDMKCPALVHGVKKVIINQ
jgi:3D (Asp-Asp-Asp) domain-containing protein